MQIINPATEELIREVPEDKAETLRAKFQLLQKARKDWAALAVCRPRLQILQKFSSGMSCRISKDWPPF